LHGTGRTVLVTLPYGQLVTVGAQLVMVLMMVVYLVSVDGAAAALVVMTGALVEMTG
jgi:hypothetical protein